MNIGKIGLTNAELIKALFLSKNNFDDDDSIYSTQIEISTQIGIASKWDDIEYTLQNDEFWLFLHDTGYTKPTRIDFIFDLICEQNLLYSEGKDENTDDEIGVDEYKTFRYFYNYFYSKAESSKSDISENSSKEKLTEVWDNVKTIFRTFEEWFNDLELYHYVGYLIACQKKKKKEVSSLLKLWREKNKKSFLDDLKDRIKKIIKGCSDLYEQYEIKSSKTKRKCKQKRECRPLLLLHNVQTVINQAKNSEDNYKMQVFYRFPFHLYKLESWDVEHIDSNTENDMDDEKSQTEYLLNCYLVVSEDVKSEIQSYIESGEQDDDTFESIKNKVEKEFNFNNDTDLLDQEEKNKIWNFTLLDSSTNRSYGNSIFSAKRRIIIGKDMGKHISIPKVSTEKRKTKIKSCEEEDAKSAFIPPCTRSIFLKYYTPVSTNPNYWTKTDAEAYLENIKDTLKDFL